MIAHDCCLSTWETEAGGYSKFQASLDYILSSRPAWAIFWVPGQPGGRDELLFYQQKDTKQNPNKEKESVKMSSLPSILYTKEIQG